MKKFVTIGHITNDTEPTDHVGGGVSYGAVAAKRLGYETHIITKCPPNHPYVTDFRNMGIHMHVLPSTRDTITTFKTRYQTVNHRTMYVPEQQEVITLHDLTLVQPDVLHDAALLVATILAEVTTDCFPYLAQFGHVFLNPQGYFRRITHGEVSQKPWMGPVKDMQSLTGIIFSQEDLRINGKVNTKLLEKFRQAVPITVMTKGDQGSIVYTKQETIVVESLHLTTEELRDPTGAGDTYAAAFTASSLQSDNLRQIASNASFYASLKMLGLGGLGINSLPTKEQYEQFITAYPDRITEFLKDNNIQHLTI